MVKRTPRQKARKAIPEGLKAPVNAETPDLTPLNFKVSSDFHREFKTYAAQQGKTMVGILQEAFALLKETYGKQQ